MMAKTGEQMIITESFRSHDRQQELYDKWHGKARVAPPGLSWHEKGLAIDIKNWEKAAPYLAKYEIVNGLPDDMGHFSRGEICIDGDVFLSACSNLYKGYETPWQILSALHWEESRRRRVQPVPSSEGALGPMQFIPNTWRRYECDGKGDTYNIEDSICAANNLVQENLKTHDNDMWLTLHRYNNADWYVNAVLDRARRLGY